MFEQFQSLAANIVKLAAEEYTKNHWLPGMRSTALTNMGNDLKALREAYTKAIGDDATMPTFADTVTPKTTFLDRLNAN